MKKKIKILALILLGLLSTNIYGQNTIGKTDDIGKIVINPYVSPQIEALPNEARSMLKNKLNQIILENGIGGTASANGRFIITPHVTVLTKNFIGSAPPMIALTMDFSFYIGDGISGNLFAETSLQVKGVGSNMNKAYINALNHINPHNPRLINMVAQGKRKIIQYYNTNCDFIQTTAKVLAQKKQYDQALANLIQVPEVCKTCYVSSQNLSVKIYNSKIEFDCAKYIQAAEVAKAQNDWDAAAGYLSQIQPGASCFKKAMALLKVVEDHRCSSAIAKARSAWAIRDYETAARYLAEVPADSKCAAQAKQLYADISGKMDADEKRDWKFFYEKYNREQTFKETKGYDLKKAQIEAARDIGVAYGKNQPRTIYQTRSWW